MGIVSLVTGQGPQLTVIKDEEGKKVLFALDATSAVTPTHDAELTDNPVEDDTDVSDGYRKKNVELMITGEISDTPLMLDLTTAAIAGGVAAARLASQYLGGFNTAAGGLAVTGATLGAGRIAASLTSTTDTRSKTERDKLLQLIDNATIITIVTRKNVYSNMMVISLSFPTDATTGGKLNLTMKLREVRIIASGEVQIKHIAKQVSHTAPVKKDLGKKPPVPEKGSSLAIGLLRQAGKFIGIGGGG